MPETSSRRQILSAAAGFAAAPLLPALAGAAEPFAPEVQTGGPFTLPPLPYGYGALERAVDARTMREHHDRHHATYVRKLNEAVAKETSLAGKTIEELLRDLEAVPESVRPDVRNQGGGHFNHTLFWPSMTPRATTPGAKTREVLAKFGGQKAFQEKFNEAGEKRFGSGWVWLVLSRDGSPEIVTTPNQDTPLSDGHTPILGNDVWEHAYYLRYQSKRAEYLKAWWRVVNWNEVERRLQVASVSDR